MTEQILSRHGCMAPSVALALACVLLLIGCNDGEVAVLREQLAATQKQEADLQEEVGRLKAVIAVHDAREAEARAAEAAVTAEKEAKWSSIRGRYRCTGGVLTGMIVRDGYAQMLMGGLEALQGNPNFRADVRGGTLYVTDPVRGAVGLKIAGGGDSLIPQSKIFGTICKRSGGSPPATAGEHAAPDSPGE